VVRTTPYFRDSRSRPGRDTIRLEWIRRVVAHSEAIVIQQDGRVRLWGYVVETNRYLRVVLLEDGETVHNAFFDRNYGRTKQ